MPHRAPLRPLVLTDEELRQLQQWARLHRRPQAVRARIVLACRLHCTNCEIAGRLGISAQTVGKWRARFALRRLPGLMDEPRCGAPRSISDDLVEAVLTKTLHEQPPDAMRWSSRQLASALGISQRAVLRIWHAFDL
jgi:transposase